MAKEKTKSPTKKKIPMMSEEKSKKLRKPKNATHPPYFQMIKEALMVLKEKNGSSPYAIAKKIEEKHKSVLPENFRKTLSLQLKNSLSKGKLVKIRASYKLSETTKMTTRSSSRRPKKTVAVNKPEMGTKKKRKVKKKPRQPKSIKYPAGKKALKASAT
ncbi:unnamed protein product [Arabis nemorensis]|uniref:H15 domain-containing protein n=1 Tax=Arabis nemorensis TaxID=586526 RepID=A0A565BCR1_9BRAS|nr:unnamed protein product [Arabis nemorensis]